MAGYPKDKNTVDNLFGNMAQTVNMCFRRAVELKTELDLVPDPTLTTMGYSAAEIAQLRTMVADLVQLRDIYAGAATLGSVKDFRASLRPLWGILGDT